MTDNITTNITADLTAHIVALDDVSLAFPLTQTRREFCAHTCRAASLIALGAVLPACGGGGGRSQTGPSAPALPVVNANVVNGSASVAIDSASALSAIGGAAQVRSSAGVFLVAHTGQDTFTALSSTCTHETCEIIGFESNLFVCPCHGARFSTNGQVVTGPATRPLTRLTAQFANGVLTIRA